MKKKFNRMNEAGTMLVEAMAMLGLIAMVTPILYKKAAERTTELQDINASNQLRVLANSMDAYIKDNFTRISNGETVVNSCNEDTVDYSTMDSDGYVTFDMSHLCEYLPYGFLKDGETQDSKLFTSDYEVALKKTTGIEENDDGEDVVVAETITGFLTAVPNEGENFPSTRLARIATMVGSNGGYVQDDGTVMGAQGIWRLEEASDVGLENLSPRTLVISSLQPISSQGLANEDVLHRKTERQNDYVLNSMETDLFMSYNDKNHNIRQVNQIIMAPQLEWMVGGDMNDFKRDDEPSMEYGQSYGANLDYTLYIGEKGGAYMEGNLAALSSLFTVRSEEGENGGIKYYGTNTIKTTGSDGNEIESTEKGNALFSVTSEKMEYGNIGSTAGGLLTVDKDDSSMTFVSKTTDTDKTTGEEVLKSTQYLIDANSARVNVMDGALMVLNPENNISGAKYEETSLNLWGESNAVPSVVIGGGNVYEGAYTSYLYKGTGTDRTPSFEDDGSFISSNFTGRYALTVNGPAFIKDSLQTLKHKAYDIDAAKLRAGVRSEDFDEVTEDDDFYMVVEQKGTVDEESGAMPGRMLVGRYEDKVWSPGSSSDRYRYRLQIAEADGTVKDASGNVTTTVSAGISMEHPSGINIRSGDSNATLRKDTHIALVGIDEDYPTSSTNIDNLIDPGQIKLGAYRAITLSTVHNAGGFIDKGIVSLQDDMLRAYNVLDGVDDYGYLDSVSDEVRFMSRNANWEDGRDFDNIYTREDGSDQGLFLLGDMDFVLSEKKKGQFSANGEEKMRPVVDIKAYREDRYISSRFSGGFAIYDYDAGYDATAVGTGIPVEYPDEPFYNKGNPSLYVSKGDFQILATEKNDDDGISKGDIILQVDNNSDTNVIADDGDRGSVYIRKGAINIAGTQSVNNTRLMNSEIQNDYRTKFISGNALNETVYPVGYIAADRFIAHVAPSDDALTASQNNSDIVSANGGTVVPYERYEVNPAYTSVMHDIKLTTRGGARLSDILPDFINKGIYVVDNTFKESLEWVTLNEIPGTEWEWASSTMENYTSAYLGYVPTPTCPQGYAKVITINPSGWAMAQAGTPVYDKESGYIDISTHNNPYLYWYTNDGNLRTEAEEVEAVNPLTFQKSTWLKAMVMPYYSTTSGTTGCFSLGENDSSCDGTGNKSTFKGWGTVLGFVYPASYYKDFVKSTYDKFGEISNKYANSNEDEQVYWNLYPVQYRQLEAYVTVYCYFNRTDFPDDMVDTTYDQLDSSKFRNYWEKVSTDNIEYMERLNDPALKYNDPW